MKRLGKLKKIIAFVFSLFLCFSPTFGITEATNAPMTNQEFCHFLLNNAIAITRDGRWDRLQSNSEECVQSAINMGKEIGLNPQGIKITFADNTEYWALALREESGVFVVYDYYQILCELDNMRISGTLLSERTLSIIFGEQGVMEINNYREAKQQQENKIIEILTLCRL